MFANKILDLALPEHRAIEVGGHLLEIAELKRRQGQSEAIIFLQCFRLSIGTVYAFYKESKWPYLVSTSGIVTLILRFDLMLAHIDGIQSLLLSIKLRHLLSWEIPLVAFLSVCRMAHRREEFFPLALIWVVSSGGWFGGMMSIVIMDCQKAYRLPLPVFVEERFLLAGVLVGIAFSLACKLDALADRAP